MRKFLSYGFFRLSHFLAFYCKAQTIYQVHSPFFYRFAREVLEDKRRFYAFSDIETLRKLFLRDKTMLEVGDQGAGSKVLSGRKRRIDHITRHSSTPPFRCRQLFRMVNLYRPSTILEVGTSFGFATSYMGAAARNAEVITLEGNKQISEYAYQNFQWLGLDNIHLLEGHFDLSLDLLLPEIEELDFIFLDGNHRYESTVNYFEKLLAKAHDHTVWVIDDIHWSRDMERAWSYIQAHPAIKGSIDLYWNGIAFQQTDILHDTHLKLVPYRWKPWLFGLW